MAVRERLYPAPQQERALEAIRDGARGLWNLIVERQDFYCNRRGWSGGFSRYRCGCSADCEATFPHVRYEHLKVLWDMSSPEIDYDSRLCQLLVNGPATCWNQVIQDYSKSVKAYFRPEKRAGRPSFHRRNDPGGFAFQGAKVRDRAGSKRYREVRIPKAGWIRFRWTRDTPEITATSVVRVTKDVVGWHVSFQSPQPAVPGLRQDGPVGVDLGTRIAMVTSDGQHYRAPRVSGSHADRYLYLQRLLSRQKRGSASRRRTILEMGVIAADVARRRKDWAEKISTRLVRDHDLIVFEDLRIANMTRRSRPKPDPEDPARYLPNNRKAKSGLNRAILASAWSPLLSRTEEKAFASPGVQVIRVDPRYTSQQCHSCGHVDPDSRKGLVFRCTRCGHDDHADRNAAMNVLARGLGARDAERPSLRNGAGHVPIALKDVPETGCSVNSRN